MHDKIFEKTLYWLKILCDRGTQREVNMNGTGESCLDPKLAFRIRAVKDIMGDKPVNMSTNAVNLTYEMAVKIKDAGIDQFDVSPHSAFHARKAVDIMRRVGLKGIVNIGAILMSHNWAGQLEFENQVDCSFDIKCDPLIEGRGYVLKEGNVTPCCYDYQNLGVFGHVFNSGLLRKEYGPYELCKTCHQKIPKEISEKAA